MSEVKRYDPNYDVISPADDSMVLTHDGLFVEASDYDQLKGKLDYANQVIDQRHTMLDTLRKQLNEARELLTFARDVARRRNRDTTAIDAWLEANK